MYIHKAVKQAINEQRCIAREIMVAIELKIQPTNGPDCCVISKKGKTPAPRWQPSAEDLMANDWFVVD